MPTQFAPHKQMIANVSILLVASLCIVYAGINAYAVIRANDLIFPAPASSYQDDASILKLQTKDGQTISAYYLESPGSERILLYSHGNGEDIGTARPFLQAFQAQGISVFAYDYPGYGTSSSGPSEAACYAAIEASFKYVASTLGYSPDQITLYGRSLGSGPSTWLAERTNVAGLILDGAFTSTFRVMTSVKLLPWDRFDNYARLPHLKCPILIIHGTNDRIVPFSHALKNWRALTGPKYKLFVKDAGHGSRIDMAGADYWNITIPFIKGELQ
ncbi:alpha/beta fold hydrolase [Coraliomargarita algicola]|uniref:Alpha/beta fold hydrolase n=1 Tax=Coraliomargarita algicola TaxID=3092156 RepID=A0ABZ0RJF9_9BACT|nr:alpha/beta fold hydrolase [Coraliomargarita sp. J2-16]WPJ95062.1 alpha/beta fold hydrolase [Coraliomargarita sp. J2-16]